MTEPGLLERNRAAVTAEQRLALAVARPARFATAPACSQCELCALPHPGAGWQACLDAAIAAWSSASSVPAARPEPTGTDRWLITDPLLIVAFAAAMLVLIVALG